MAIHIRRREFIFTLGGAAAARPLAARAQQPAMPVVGCLHAASAHPFPHLISEFSQGLKEIGYAEGRNGALEFHWAEGRYERLPALAADLVRRQVAVIVTFGGEPSALAAKAATKTIPIVFNVGSDPVKARPRRQSQPAWRQRHGREHIRRRIGLEASRPAALPDPLDIRHRPSRGPEFSARRA